jgi:hypothetical protein
MKGARIMAQQFMYFGYLSTFFELRKCRRMLRRFVNDELGMLKSAILAYFKALSWNFPEGTEKNHNKVVKTATL